MTEDEANTLPAPKCCCRQVFNGNREALAWALDSVGRSIQAISSASFLATAILNLAKEAAGCETEILAGETKLPECHGRIYGIRPSSLLTSYSVVVGVLATVFMPLIGAVIDYTSHRLHVGRVLAMIACALMIPTLFVSEKLWFVIAIVQILQGFVGSGLNLIKYSYLPELTEEKELLSKYVASFTAIPFGGMVLFLVVLIGSFSFAGISDDDILSARISQGVASIILTLTMYFAYARLFEARPPLHILPEGTSLLTAGFRQVYQTGCYIVKHQRALKWFYIQNSFTDAMLESLPAIVITFTTDTLEFKSSENGIVIMITLVSSIPGSLTAGWLNHRFKKPIMSTISAFLLLITTNVLAGVFLRGPDQRIGSFIAAFGWGMGYGWNRTCNEFMSSTLIPKGQDSEMMGIFLFTRSFLAWIPPLMFTMLNESGVDQRYILIALSIFFLFALGSCILIGNFAEAVASTETVKEDQVVLSEGGSTTHQQVLEDGSLAVL